jgi:hypothetical protein
MATHPVPCNAGAGPIGVHLWERSRSTPVLYYRKTKHLSQVDWLWYVNDSSVVAKRNT